MRLSYGTKIEAGSLTVRIYFFARVPVHFLPHLAYGYRPFSQWSASIVIQLLGGRGFLRSVSTACFLRFFSWDGIRQKYIDMFFVLQLY